MTISNQTSSVTLTGDGVVTSWPYSFLIPDAASARVGIYDITAKTLTTLAGSDYTITGLGSAAGGEVTYPLTGSPLTSNQRIVIWRELALTQDTDLTNQTPYYADVLEAQLDNIVMMVQQLKDETDRSVKATPGSNLSADEFVVDLYDASERAVASADAAAGSELAAATSAGAAATARDEAVAGVGPKVFSAVSALRLFSAATSATMVILLGYHDLSLKGGGNFALDSGDTTTADDGGYVIVDAAGRRWKRVDDGHRPTLYEFGAIDDGSTDNSTSILNALSYAEKSGRGLLIPGAHPYMGATHGAERHFRYGSTVTQKYGTMIIGEHMKSSKLVYTGAYTAWYVNPDSTYANDNTFWQWENFSIAHATAGGGTYGFLITVGEAGEYVSNGFGKNVYIGEFGTRSMYWNVAGGIGIFSMKWADFWLAGGFQGNSIGDSILFERGTINSGSTQVGLLVTQIAGAREIIFDHLNITCLGGGASIAASVTGAMFLNTWFELPSYLGDYSGSDSAYVVIAGNKCKLWNCTIQPLYTAAITTTSAVLLSGNDNDVRGTEIGRGETDHIAVTGARNIIQADNTEISGGTLVITDSAITTRNFYAPGRFRAYPAANQTGIVSATLTKVAFNTELTDVGGHYDTTLYRWTPKAGLVDLKAVIRFEAGIVDGTIAFAGIYKNGIQIAYGPIQHTGSLNVVGVGVACTDVADGDDYYEVFVEMGGAGNKTVFGNRFFTWFEGTWKRAA